MYTAHTCAAVRPSLYSPECVPSLFPSLSFSLSLVSLSTRSLGTRTCSLGTYFPPFTTIHSLSVLPYHSLSIAQRVVLSFPRFIIVCATFLRFHLLSLCFSSPDRAFFWAIVRHSFFYVFKLSAYFKPLGKLVARSEK